MNIISVSNLEKSFGEKQVLLPLSFEVGERDRVGLVGPNGAGKTTLFKLITGELQPDGGHIYPSKLLELGYMQQHTCSENRALYDEMESVFAPLKAMEQELEAIARQIEAETGDPAALIHAQHQLLQTFEAKGGLTYQSRSRATLLGLGFAEQDFAMSCSHLSGGQKSKIALGKLLISGANCLLLDEPTNHLDIASLEWLEEFIRDFHGAALIISHDRFFLDRTVNRILELQNNKLTAYTGNYSEYLRKKEENLEIEKRHYTNQMREIHRIEGIIAQQKRWNRERNLRVAHSKEKQVARLQAELPTLEKAEKAIRFRFTVPQPGSNDVLIGERLTKRYGDKVLLQDTGLHIRQGERVFLIGMNGCGKTTLFKIITGALRPDAGRTALGPSVKVGYFDQTQENLHPDKSALQEIQDTYPNLTGTDVRNALAAFKFYGEEVFRPISVLSGGERARVALLKLMLSGANFLLLDEPTNHLDLYSREALEEALLDYEGALFMISHDRYFINKLADRIIALEEGTLRETVGNYDDYAQAKKAAVTVPQAPVKKAPNAYRQQKQEESARRMLLGRIRRCEAEIEGLDATLADLQAALEVPDIAADYEKILAKTQAIESVQVRQAALLEEWESLHLQLEA